MVWRAVTHFGIGHCEFNGKLYIVARYYPHPNMPTEFLDNIFPLKEMTEMYKGTELKSRKHSEDEIVTLLELKADNEDRAGYLQVKAGQCIRPSLKYGIKFKDWDDFRYRNGEYADEDQQQERTNGKKGPPIFKGPPLIGAYFNNKFGKVSASILKPVKPQYVFYKAEQKHDGKLVDELTFKRGAVIKYLGLTISGRTHHYYEPPKEAEKKDEKLADENLWMLGELGNGEIGFYPVSRADCEGKLKHNQLRPMYSISHEGPYHEYNSGTGHAKPRMPWTTNNFEDHRRFDSKATLKYDLMLVQNNYDPKMDGLFNPAMVDVFHEMRALEVVKSLRIKLDDPNLAVIEFRGRQRLVPVRVTYIYLCVYVTNTIQDMFILAKFLSESNLPKTKRPCCNQFRAQVFWSTQSIITTCPSKPLVTLKNLRCAI